MYKGKDELAVMRDDLTRALKATEVKWAMLIDLRGCVGCRACAVACMAEHKSPPGIAYRPVYEEESGSHPHVKRRFTPRPCNQCDNPLCVKACPNPGEGKATWKSRQGITGGIVMVNYEQCIGCGRCVAACPYKARALDGGAFYTEGTPKLEAYEMAPTWEYGRKWPREKNHLPVGVARKCHFCIHRLKTAMLPMCVTSCISRTTFFGNIKDKESLIYRKITENRVKVLTHVAPKIDWEIKTGMFKGMSAADISKTVGYPGLAPVFGEQAETRPSVYYILP